MNIVKSDINKWRVSITLLFLLFLLLSFPLKSHSAITNPYIIDEKSRVHFGDIVEIIDGDKTYFGLENYSHEYANGFLHISYTYTHHTCCYDTHTPQIYITNVDPRSTTTPTIKSLLFVYPFSPGELTDWYLIDIQFDETGYVVSVKRRGITEIFNTHVVVENLLPGDWVALANNHPMGPDNTPISDSMAFIPLLYKQNATEPAKNPVIIVPGIMASYITDSNLNEKWPSLPLMVLPGDDSYLDVLRLDSSGLSSNSLIAPKIIKEIEGNIFFSSLFESLNSKGYIDNKNIFEFPYDWRLDINTDAQQLKNKIDYIKNITGAVKVNLVAHSMGGLVVKEYIKQFGGDSINKFIDIATPHTGAPKAFKIINYGDDMGFKPLGLSILNANEVKNIVQNMPSVYALLPSQNYFDSNDNNYKYYVLDGTEGNNRYTFEQTKNYLNKVGRNSTLIEKADIFHQGVDNINPADFGVKTINIVGCGTPTIGQFYILSKKNDGSYEFNIKMISGDGTVPFKSAVAIPALKTYYAKQGLHATLPSTLGINELISDLITSDSNPNISLFPNLTTNESECPKLNGQLVSFHSPIDLHVFDEGNNHVGPKSNGDIEEGIPGVMYEIINGNKFAYLPSGKEYTIKGKATDSGTFNARIETIQDETVIETKYFHEIPIIQTSEVVVNQSTISIDDNKDGIFEKEIPASAVLDKNQSLDFIKPITTVFLTGNKQNDGTYSSSVNVKFFSTDDNSGILKTEYSLNEGYNWKLYDMPFAINSRGLNNVIYRSIDRAGNIEIQKIVKININKK